MFTRFHTGPCGIFARCWSPIVSASAPHEQIHPQYAPLPHRQMMAGMMTNVCTNEITSHNHIGCGVKTLYTFNGNARMNPYARQYARSCPVPSYHSNK